MRSLWCELAWLGGPQPVAGVRLGIEDGVIVAVEAGAPSEGAEGLAGLVLPGLANAHSHTFQRALRGRTHGGEGTFWTWREQMYELAARVDPDAVHALARATFAEMALAGITCAGEFHYLHHSPGGAAYAAPNELGEAVVAAAGEAGVRLTLLDACYLRGGLERFRDPSVEAWCDRVAELREGPLHRVGAAIHSVRAVPPEAAGVVAAWASDRGRPLHAHVSEQPAENEATLAAHARTPAALLERAGAFDASFTAVHATHLTDEDVALLATATVCLCPTTERDLGDGVGPARRLREAGAALALGSDSHAVIDLFEEARAVELDERLATLTRGHHRGCDLLAAATEGGYASLGWPEGGRIAAGAAADLAVVSLGGVRLAGTRAEDAVDAAVFAAAAGDVRHVMVAGEWIVRDGTHVRLDVERELAEAIGR